MPSHIVDSLKKTLKSKNKNLMHSKVLIMGYTFKENCPDTRNTKVLDLVKILKNKKAEVTIFDPLITKSDLKEVLPNINFSKSPKKNFFDAVLICVPHKNLKKWVQKK